MNKEQVIDIVGYGAWNGGRLTDNTIYEGKGMFFKNGIPVNGRTIEERIGVRSRMAAPGNARIGTLALADLLKTIPIDPQKIKILIGATNVGEDKYEPGPSIQHSYDLLRRVCPDALCFDLYAGCPGYNVAVELLFVMSLAGQLKAGDVSVVVGAENLHRAQAFPPMDTANIIFGDDAMATAFQTESDRKSQKSVWRSESFSIALERDFIGHIARVIRRHNGNRKIDGIIVDNQLGHLTYRIPATAARIQQRLAEITYPAETEKGTWEQFKNSLSFYNQHIDSFAFDIMTLAADTARVEEIAAAYVLSGKYGCIVSVFLSKDNTAQLVFHSADGVAFKRPHYGIVDTRTRTHGCFAGFIEAQPVNGDVFGTMDGKGVFLYATRGVREHIDALLSANRLTVDDIDLFIEHQANFAMIPMTMEKLLNGRHAELKQAVFNVVADKMITNVHTRGNCSVVCMQRLPYDLSRGFLEQDEINGYVVNRNLTQLKKANIILSDSVGAGMTRSSFLRRKRN